MRIWIKHKNINEQLEIDTIFYRGDRPSLCIDFNNYKSQIDIFIQPPMIKEVIYQLRKMMGEKVERKKTK